MVFQSYALYPHMTVAENMGFALRIAGRPRKEVDAAVRRAAESLQLEALHDRKPPALSGGQRQRVAIGRAIVREPKVFLFDEPLSNLDASLRTQMRLEMARLHERLGATIVYVTHDQVEAMTLGDRIAVFNAGRIEQVGSPSEVYRRPVNRFVAGFLGSPRMNFLPAQAGRDDAGAGVQVAEARAVSRCRPIARPRSATCTRSACGPSSGSCPRRKARAGSRPRSSASSGWATSRWCIASSRAARRRISMPTPSASRRRPSATRRCAMARPCACMRSRAT